MSDAPDLQQTRLRQTQWLAAIPQFAAGAAAIAVAWLITSSAPHGAVWGSGVYLVYSFGSRALIPRAHHRGIRLFQIEQYEQAIDAYTESYEFFTRHAWLDRFRSITMMTASVFSYREMALWNTASCYVQMGDGQKAREYYERLLVEFPHCCAANAALEELDSIEQQPSATE